MDMLILLAVFVALLALAYVTYRNIHNLDSRLRRIEDVLKNAQVVAEPINNTDVEEPMVHQNHEESTDDNVRESHEDMTSSGPSTNKMSPYANRYGMGMADSFDGPVPGWGGEGAALPKVTVAKEGHDNDEEQTKHINVVPDENVDDGELSDDELSEENDDSDIVNVDDILNDMEQNDADDRRHELPTDSTPVTSSHNFSSVKVADLRRVLREASIHIPNGAKKADLIKLIEDNQLQLAHNDHEDTSELVEVD